MLRLIPKIIALTLALTLVVVGGILVALPRLVNTEEFRTALRESALEALGAPIEWSALEAGVAPLRLTMSDPVLVAEATNRDQARLTAAKIDLRLSAMALLQNKIQVESLVLSGVELLVTRTPEGLVLPISAGSEEGEAIDRGSVPSPNSPQETPDVKEDALPLALRRFVIEDSRIVVRDETLSSVVEWQFEGVRVVATGDSLDQPLALNATASVAANGRDAGNIRVLGDLSLAGLYDLGVTLDALQLVELQPYIQDATIAGALSGTIRMEGAEGVVSKVESDLEVARMVVKSFGLDLVGEFDLEANQALDEPVDFEAMLDLGSEGSANISGKVGLNGALDAVIDLTSFELAPYAALAEQELDVSGRATGRVEITTTADAGLARLETDLKILNARYADAALALGGTLDLELGLEGLEPTDPVRFDIALALDDGGGLIDAEGKATMGGAVDVKLALENMDLSPAAHWVPGGSKIAGRLTGDVDLVMSADSVIESVSAKLAVAEARVVSDLLDVSGRLDFDIERVGKEPIQLTAELKLNDGSALIATGTSTEAGVVDLKASLEAFDLAMARPFLPDPKMKLAGVASGVGRLVGDAASPEFLSFDVGIEAGAFITEDYSVEGPFLAVIKIKEPLSQPRGRIDLDLTGASLRYLDQFTKPAGMRAEMTTQFVPEESGEIVFESKLKLRDVDEILLQGAIGETTSVALTTKKFNLNGWSEIFPVLDEYKVDGEIAFDGLSVELVEGVPNEFGGRISLHGVGVNVLESGQVRLRGTILGEGNRIRTQGLKALVGGVVLGIKGGIEEFLDEGRFDLEIATQGEAETNDVLSNLTTSKDIVFGALDFKGQVTGRLGEPRGVTETLAGNVRFSIGEGEGGELRGVSILQTVLDQIPLLGGAARLSQPFRRGSSVDHYFAERFDVIEGDFVVGEGKIVAETLRLAYPGYEARLLGPLRLRDLTVDMTGELLLKGDLVLALGGFAGAHLADRKPIRIELARVTNTLSDPKVVLTKSTLAAVPKLLFQATGLDTITLGIGKGVGKALDRVIHTGN